MENVSFHSILTNAVNDDMRMDVAGLVATVCMGGGRKIFCVYGKNSSLIRNRYV